MSVVGRSRGGEKKCFRLVGRSGGGEKKNNKNKSGVGEEKNCNKKEFVGSSVGWAVRRQRRTKWGKNCVGWSVDQSRKNQSCTLVEGRWAGAEVRLLFGLNSAVKKIRCPKASNGQRFPCPALTSLVLLRGKQGSCPDSGRSAVEWGDFPFVRPFPPLGHPARPEAQSARPEA